MRLIWKRAIISSQFIVIILLAFPCCGTRRTGDIFVRGFCTPETGSEVPVLEYLQSGSKAGSKVASYFLCKNANPNTSRSKSRTVVLGEIKTSSKYYLCQASKLKVPGCLLWKTGWTQLYPKFATWEFLALVVFSSFLMLWWLTISTPYTLNVALACNFILRSLLHKDIFTTLTKNALCYSGGENDWVRFSLVTAQFGKLTLLWLAYIHQMWNV